MSNLAKIDRDNAGQSIATIGDSAALMSAVARAAADPSVDVEKMERLFAMHERMTARQAEQDYAAAMKAAQAAMPSIFRGKENKQTKSWYADLEAITKAIVPVYTAQGFSLSFGQADCPIDNAIRVTCEVSHSGGHSKSFWYDNPIDDAGIAGAKNKTQTHGRASATSYARRYLTIMIFNLTLSGEDDDGNGATAPYQEPVDAKAKDWIGQANRLQNAEDYAPLKAKMMADYGGVVKSIPRDVQLAFNSAMTRVMPRDEEA